MNGPLQLDLGILADGVLTYRDTGQIHIVRAVQEVLKWDITELDAWLFGREHWRNYPRVRQRLICWRERLTHAFESDTGNADALILGIAEYFRETRRVALRLDNLPDSLRIQQAYRNLVQSGQKYGAQTTLARQYGVPVTLIRKMLLSVQTL